MPEQRLIALHCMDPRGTKVGGIETHVRQLLRHHPRDLSLLLIGIDERGDLPLGQVARIEVAGRTIEFVPVLRVAAADQTGASKTVAGSLTFRFVVAVLLHFFKLRRIVSRFPASAEVERFEFAPIASLLGCPLVVLVHNEGDPKRDKMDSLLKRYWWINDAAEWLAFCLARRVFCVTPKLKERLTERHPAQGKKAEVLTVSVDTAQFRATPFDLADGKLRLIYAGRLDEFKDPPLMFRVAKEVHQALGGAFEFHYCGASDPNRFAEFAAIEPFTVRHGALAPDDVAAVMRRAHIGVLTSYWEGMPCFLLELLASGRPFAGLRLPQFDQVVKPGINGRMTERADTIEDSTKAVSEAVLALWDDVKSGRIDPALVHEQILPFSVDRQLHKLFRVHRDLGAPGTLKPVTA